MLCAQLCAQLQAEHRRARAQTAKALLAINSSPRLRSDSFSPACVCALTL